MSRSTLWRLSAIALATSLVLGPGPAAATRLGTAPQPTTQTNAPGTPSSQPATRTKSPSTAPYSATDPAQAPNPNDTEQHGAPGDKATPGVTFPSFAAVVKYGLARFPNDKGRRPPDEETPQGEKAKERSDNGESPPTTKPIVEIGRGGISPAAPTLGRSFSGITGGNPPDSNMAAGPHNLVVVANTGVRILGKNGTVLSGTPTLNQFFASVASGGAAGGGAFDPRAVFDPYISRFWIVAGDEIDPVGSTAGLSTVLIALSNTDDATGAWTFFIVNTRLNGGSTVGQWCDYPMLGVSSDSIFISCNMFNFPARSGPGFGSAYAKVRIMTKGQFLTNTCCLWWDTWNLREGTFGGAAAFTVQPAIMYNGSGFGEFLVDAQGGGGSGSAFSVWRITNAANCCVSGSQSSPTWDNQAIGVGSYPAPPSARQSGITGRLSTGDTRLQYAFWRGSMLSTGQGTACNNGSGGLDACVAFTEINVSSFPSSMTLVNDWALHPANGVDEYFPAVAGNPAGDKTMVYSQSSSSESVSAAFIGIPGSSTCTLCANGPEAILLAGTATTTCTPVPPATTCTPRWGDYHGASPDPDGTGIWIAGQALAGSPIRRTTQVGLTMEAGDSTPPVTTASLNPQPEDSGWNLSKPVTVTLTTTDAESGPWKITYGVTNGPPIIIPTTTVKAATTSFQIQLEGDSVVKFHGTDGWGNAEAEKTLTVHIDSRQQKIVFASTRDGNSRGGHEIYVMNRDGSGQQRLTVNNADDTQPVLDSLGRVYFTSNRDGDYEIYRLDTSGVTQLTHNTATDIDPAVNAGGTTLAFASDRGGDFGIYTMDSGGGSVTGPLNSTPYAELEPAWVRGTARLAYVHDDHDPNNDIIDYNIYLTNPSELLGTPGEDRRPAWKPDGYKVAAYLDGDIVVYNVGTGSTFTYLTSGPATDDSPTWSPYGGFIAFHTDRTGDNEIFRMTNGGGLITNLTNNSAGQDVEPNWARIGDGYTLGVELPTLNLTVYEGRVFEFSTVVRNHAPYALHGEDLVLPFTNGLVITRATVPGGDCGFSPTEVHCYLGTLEPGATQAITVDARARRSGPLALIAHTLTAEGDTASAVRVVPALANPPSTASVDVVNNAFKPATAGLELGGTCTWTFGGTYTETVTDSSGMGLFDSGPRDPGSTYAHAFSSAGSYGYRSTFHPSRMNGVVTVPVQALLTGVGDSIVVGWATAGPGPGRVEDVQVRFRGGTDSPWSGWTTWKLGTKATGDVFEPDRGPGEYQFQARLRAPKTGNTTGWSPPVSVVLP